MTGAGESLPLTKAKIYGMTPGMRRNPMASVHPDRVRKVRQCLREKGIYLPNTAVRDALISVWGTRWQRRELEDGSINRLAERVAHIYGYRDVWF